MKVEIKCRFSGSVLFAHEQTDNTMILTLEAAVKARANLDGAYLDGAYLARANLAGAYLDGANLAGANLDGANLAGAYLARANLDGTNLDGEVLTKPPISLPNMTWPVLITNGYMRIGCQRHTHEEWRAFDNSVIAAMESRAADFWGRWGAVLLAMCDAHKGAA